MSLKFSVASAAIFILLTLSSISRAQEIDKDQLSYSIGVQFGKMIEHSADRVDMDALTRGLKAAMSGADLEMSEEEIGALMTQFQQLMQKDRETAMTDPGRKFLEAKSKEEGVVTLPSGLMYKVIRAGTGATPNASDSVETHYRGTFPDGKQFDSSYDRNEPMSFGVTGVIAGWTEALQLMKVGGKWELYVPYDLAYGARARPDIPAYSTLVFEIELLGIAE